MTSAADWEAHNNAYLGHVLTWLRALLEHRILLSRGPSSPEPAVASSISAPESPNARRGLFRRSTPLPPASESASPQLPSADPVRLSAERVLHAERELREAAHPEQPAPSALLLARALGLSTFELNLLLLCTAVELDTRVAELCATLHNDAGRGQPSFGLGMTLFENPAWEALSPDRPLRYFRLLEITASSGFSLTASPLCVDQRILSFIKGLNYLDDRLAQQVLPLRAPLTNLPPSQREVVEQILAQVAAAASSGLPPRIRLAGQDAIGRRQVALAACKTLGLTTLRLSAEVLPDSASELDALARLWQREHQLLPLALYADTSGFERATETSTKLQQLARFLALTSGLVFLDAKEELPIAVESAPTLEVRRPLAAEQRAVWESLLPAAEMQNASLLAGQFDLSIADIHDVAQQHASKLGELTSHLWGACRSKTRPAIDSLAQRVEVKAGWLDLVLPEQELSLLQRLAAQVRTRGRVYDDWGFRDRASRGLGISALFAGDSGTGKTLAAEVLAHELNIDLYRIDLSAVVSKYIGDTEKNLRKVFDAAEQGGAILFFDEADALFGKRSEVRDSHDRYANIEVNYLLQRMEAFGGLAILATNIKGALDTAFVRRLRFIVNFPHPGHAERRRMWERAFPAAMPRKSLDYDRLSKLNVTGGHIHNIVLNAAFLAAQAAEPVDMGHVLEAARMEFRKLGQRINEADLRVGNGAGAVA